MLLLLLTALACTTPEPPAAEPEPAPATEAPPVLELAPPSPQDLATELEDAAEGDIDAELVAAIAGHCGRLETCGCLDGQTPQQCNSSASRANLPPSVYACTTSLPCELLCKPMPGGTADKGATPCVIPYIKSQIPGGPSQGPALKGRRTEKKPLDDRTRTILQEEAAK